jgi:hypothetical protein
MTSQRMIVLAVILPVLALFAPPAASAAQSQHWKQYRNERYGMRIEYPSAMFKPERPPENGDGMIFKTEDGRATLRVSGGFNVLERSVAQMRAEAIQSRAATRLRANKITAKGFDLDGSSNEGDFHLRVFLSNGANVIDTLEITYPPESQARFRPIARRIVKSFRSGKSDWYKNCCR